MNPNKRQSSLLNWAVVKEQIQRNRTPRLNWKIMIGMSLNAAVAKFRSAGVGPDLMYSVMVMDHPEWTYETRRRLQIGICARYGEQKIVENAQK